ncbi:hypothetical protein P691DRAFT_850066, partial [Macrolepiota fuliginosa MF-IS2]
MCHTYKKYHQILQDTSDTLYIYLLDIWRAKAGITVLAKLLKKSGAFTKFRAGPPNETCPQPRTPLDWSPGEDQEDQGQSFNCHK